MIPAFIQYKFAYFFELSTDKKFEFFISLVQYVKKLLKGKEMIYFDLNAESIDYNQSINEFFSEQQEIQSYQNAIYQNKSFCPIELLTKRQVNETSNGYSIAVMMSLLSGICEKKLVCKKDAEGKEIYFEKSFIKRNAVSTVKNAFKISEPRADRFVYLISRMMNDNPERRPTLEQVEFALMKINLPEHLFDFLLKVEQITLMLEKKVESLEKEMQNNVKTKLNVELGVNMLKYALGNKIEDEKSWRPLNEDATNLYDLCRNIVTKTKENSKLYDMQYFSENLNKIVLETLTPETIKATHSESIIDKIKLFFSKTIPIAARFELSFFGTIKEARKIAQNTSPKKYETPNLDFNS
jgi:hypothetical protein